MTYKIIDVIKGTIVAIMDSEAKVLNWFSRLGRLEELNVTGKDMRSPNKGMDKGKNYFYSQGNFQLLRTYRLPVGNGCPVYNWDAFRLRRYQVIDEDGRSIDPREWESEPSQEDDVPFRLEIGKPRHTRHRGRGKPLSFIRQMQKEAAAGLELDVRPVRVNTKLRMHKYDNTRLFRSEEWKCWKNKKAARQWGKHKKSFVHPAKLADALMSVEEVDTMDWATVGIIDEVLLQNIENLEQLICDRITELDGIPDEVISEAECREIELLRLLNPLEDIQCHGDCRNMSIFFTDNEDIYRTYLAEEIEMLEYCAKPVVF